ncbi:tRNA (adenosine(37)-N6)-dimethylallyltransferase MiaA [Methylophaga pinxianii]|uniref:tRNA (adenosine(37)-N6)-dimethylallyltransferase MiaA n=1 Tax=Methylophaga pinxianii TaxID=2881052 RepID=UPI001CF352B3|nr:tRNA (adenosine(37)-N6)-dimethylallyltransferase MiaA [Methylophaga pinxianii]MCB2426875.1 tRNA (adenosine(37)-N6)-dimethylallyltransferase MiaA [Methylophaga pinxianii]UPH47108.1 tRNA (adenosine(37)-N6)-dimethylallyltransferase MiaA [Methylophaga pinxianii]
MGPTAAGKTDLALFLSQHLPVEIISVDSALIYRQMDIGTAKPGVGTLKKFPHHLVNIIDPKETYSAGRFRQDALTLMADITRRGKIPLLVGGTMLYFKTLQYGIADLPEADIHVRERLQEQLEEYGLSALHKRLSEVDPVSAKRIHLNDPQRLLRALEVYELSGKSLTELTQYSEFLLPYKVIKVIVSPFDRKILHKRIADRYQKMMQAGFISEVKNLYDRGDLHCSLPSIRAVGYRQAWSFLSGEYDESTFIEKAIIATRQMAKRQLTWLRAQKDGVWFDSGIDLPEKQVLDFVRCKLAEADKA